MSNDAPAILIDGTNRIYTLWFGCRVAATAVAMLIDEIVYLQAKQKPAWVSVAFDPPGKTFRHELFPMYKAGRPAKDPDLVLALHLAREAMHKRGLAVMEARGFEADDCLATACHAAAGRKTIIYSTDKDVRQLLRNDWVTCLRGMKTTRTGREPHWYSETHLRHEFGFNADRWVDYQCLVGDRTDNVAGAQGIGSVFAKRWLKDRTLAEIFLNPWSVATSHQQIGLRELEKRIDVVRQLVTLRKDVPI